MSKIRHIDGVSPARVVSALTLAEIAASPFAQASDVLATQARRHGLKEDDIRLARAIIFGVLRNALTLDHYYQGFLRQPAHRLTEPVRICLRVAACQQWLLTRIPPFAIVNETVEVAKRVFRLSSHEVGFINAVARKIIALSVPPDLPAGNRVRDLSVRYSMPVHLVDMLVGKYGTHKSVAILQAMQNESPLTLRSNALKGSAESLFASLAAQGIIIGPAPLPESGRVESVEPGQSLFETPEYHSGCFYVQDAASQLVAHIVNPQAGETILDYSSAPGGKTTHLAELSGGEAVITATDISEDRLKLLEENIARLGTPGVTIRPIAELAAAPALFDAVLLDAPCTGLGTLRKNPEIRYRVTPDTLNEQATKQLEILEAASRFVRPKGRLVYSTCSFSNAENRDVISTFLKTNPDFILCEEPANDTVKEYLAPDGFYRTWPQHPEMDGFEAAVLKRAEGDR